jgi:hypothetical protein
MPDAEVSQGQRRCHAVELPPVDSHASLLKWLSYLLTESTRAETLRSG